MAIEKRFIHFKRFSDFNSKKLSANEANTQYTVGVSGAIQNGAPDILYQSYVWIKDTKQQWTHGQLYDGTNLNEAGFLAGEETSDQLDDVETHTYVKYVPQTLTDEQKAQTRINIGAVSEENFKTINGESILGSGDMEISGGEDIRYFTEFTMENFHNINNYDNSELISAAQNNKIICIPNSISSGVTGYYIPSYHCVHDNGVLLYIKILRDGVEYNLEKDPHTPSFNIYYTSYKTKVEYIYDTGSFVNIVDNILYLAQEELSSLSIYEALPLELGSTIRFTPSEDFVLRMPENTLWVNGVIPEIEPYTQYELSLTMNQNGSFLAVLTPFKPVE